MQVMYVFTPDEVIEQMRYIGEIYKLGSRPMDTGRAKRLYATTMSDLNQNVVEKMVERCKYAYAHGLKENITMTAEEVVVLRRLVDFVAMVYQVPGRLPDISKLKEVR